jgi:hypothetical protein
MFHFTVKVLVLTLFCTHWITDIFKKLSTSHSLAWIFYPTPFVLFLLGGGFILNSCFTVLLFSFVYQTVGVLVKLLENWGFVSGRADICLLSSVWTGSGVHSVCIHWILVHEPWEKVAGHEAKMLRKNGAAVSPFPTCLIHSVVLA